MHYTDPIIAGPQVKCTNTPMFCSICPEPSNGHVPTIWKYSAHLHIVSQHSIPFDDDEDAKIAIPAQMAIDMFISKAEETYMGVIAEVTNTYRQDFSIPDSDAIEPLRKRDRSSTLTVEIGTVSKRARTGTYSRVILS